MKNTKRTKKMPVIRKTTIACSVLTLAAITVFSLYFSYGYLTKIPDHPANGVNPVLFAALMALLPLAGMPITLFLIVVGMIYGLTGGLAVTAGIILFHMIMTYYLVHSLLRPLIVRLLEKFRLSIPQLPRKGKKRLGFIFMIIPGLPYTAKNYLFALTGMPLRPYLLISWTTQFALAIPFIVLGKGVMDMDPVILFTGLGIILLGGLGQRYIRNYYKNL